jgi:hypothetical protein
MPLTGLPASDGSRCWASQRVSGRLRGDDLREFKPAMEQLLKTGEIRIVEVIASDYET